MQYFPRGRNEAVKILSWMRQSKFKILPIRVKTITAKYTSYLAIVHLAVGNVDDGSICEVRGLARGVTEGFALLKC
jgi:hypothetical protein